MSKKKKRQVRFEKEKKTRKKARQEDWSHFVEVFEEVAITPYDENLLETARTRWQFGDWNRLAVIDENQIKNHPQREKIALLISSAHFQRGDIHSATRYLRLAQDWGCSRRLVAQILVSGTHNSLACATLILGEATRAQEHFTNAVKLGGVPGDKRLLTQARFDWQLENGNI